jgi:hypothetical protein
LLLSLGHHVLVLDTHETSAPVLSGVDVVVILGHEVLLQGVEVLEVLLSHLGQGDAGGGLGVAELSESGLTLDNAVWNLLLSAESWKVDHHLEWVDIVGNDNKLGLTLLN